MSEIGRRRFLKAAGIGAAVGAVQSSGGPPPPAFHVAIVLDPQDPVAASTPVKWAAEELRQAFAGLHGGTVEARVVSRVSDARSDERVIVATGARDSSVPNEAGSMVLSLVQIEGRPVLMASGRDATGLVYALLEITDRVRNGGADVGAAFEIKHAVSERPANAVRSVTRLFCSDVEDKGWFYDREMWPKYLTMLATHRYNRFNLSLGIGYDFIREVTDAYFLFAYPFLISVPGYQVRASNLSDQERDRNLAMLRYISELTVERGMQFQLGIWTHGYQWINSPSPNHTIEGVTKENHGLYCRDAVRLLLQKLPAVSGVTFRVHGESGVEEGSYEFWKTVFEGVQTCGRTVRLDMHSKGMDQSMLDLGVRTGLPLTISPKYWAEHMGMPYHQADIRPVEYPRPDGSSGALMKLSAGSRNFTRYGYADLLREDRKWNVMHRIWPGTQRLLLWGDPQAAAAYSKAFSFCGSEGVEIMEPLSFKGRRGSGLAGDRTAYADPALRPRWDWEKYEYQHRVWGRMLYNPACDADAWQRALRKDFGSIEAAAAAESALSHASRILPIVTTAHCPSAANNVYWPELYTNQPLVEEGPNPYGDTPSPKVFGNVSALDPQLFERINDYADDLLAGKSSGKYSPVEVARWLDDHALAATKGLASFEKRLRGGGANSKRWVHDIAIQAGLGRFFAAKFRAGVLYRLFEKTMDRGALEACIRQYKVARTAWAELAARAKNVYVSDITVGERTFLRGHWTDRLAAIDSDIAAVERKLVGAKPDGSTSVAIAKVLERRGSQRRLPQVRHVIKSEFKPGDAIPLECAAVAPTTLTTVRLHYRHVDHAERFESVVMESRNGRFFATVPAEYTKAAYPIQYYFEMDSNSLYPGLGVDQLDQPYFVMRRARA